MRVHAYDVNAERVELAMSLGALSMPVDAVPGSVDLVLDTVGTPASIEVALANVGTGGTVVVIGLDAHPFELSAQTLVRRQLVLRGSLTYDHPVDFRATVARVREGGVIARRRRHRRVPPGRCPARIRVERLRPGEDVDPGGAVGATLKPPRRRAADTAARNPSK